MRLYAKLHPDQHLTIRTELGNRQYDATGKEIPYQSPYFKREDGWYPLVREPGHREYVIYDKEKDELVIQRWEEPSDLEVQKKQAAIKRKLAAELPDIILQNKDNPEALTQALCERAKQIEVEMKDEPRRDTEAL